MRLRQSWLWASALTLALSGTIVLTGCGEKPETLAIPAPKAVEETTPPPEPEPVVIPSCDAMNSAAQQQYEDFGVEMFAEPAGETDLAAFNEISGTVAQNAMAEAVQQRGCRWPVHSQATVTEYVAELSEAAQVPMIEALRADPAVAEAILGTAVSFSYESPAPNGYMSVTEVTYLFVGDLWISIFDYAGQQEYAQAALDGVLEVNPSLKEQKSSDEATVEPSASCSSRTGLEMLAEWAPTVEGGPWDTTGQFSDVSGYDGCATLSWIVLRPEPCCTRFSATPVMFFLHGDFYQLATETHYAVEDDIERLADNQASVTYMWQAAGSSNADAPATATSTFTLNRETGLIDREGELPPS